MASEPNWPVGLLASAYQAKRDSQGMMMAISVGYFDHADTGGTVTVSGYVTSKVRWRYFEERWPRLLRSEDLSQFNGADFIRSDGEFSNGWAANEPRRRRLTNVLAALVDQHVMRGFSCSIPTDLFDALSDEYDLGDISGPYGLCAARIVARVQRWMAERHPYDLTLFVFEDGDIDHRQIRRALAADGIDRGEPVQIWPRRWTDERGRLRHLRPFEACDLLMPKCHSAILERLSTRHAWESEVIERNRLVSVCQTLGVRRGASPTARAAARHR